jgi:Flp pilus assembly protein TadD
LQHGGGLYAASLLDPARRIGRVFGWLSKREKPGSQASAKTEERAGHLIAQGNRAEDAGELARACELYRQAATLAPASAKAHLNLGIGLEACGDVRGARASYEKALAIEPSSAAANYNRL